MKFGLREWILGRVEYDTRVSDIPLNLILPLVLIPMIAIIVISIICYRWVPLIRCFCCPKAFKVLPDRFQLSLQKLSSSFLWAAELRKAVTAGNMYEHQFIPLTHTKFLGVSQPSPSFIHKNNNWSQTCQPHNLQTELHAYILEMAAKVPLVKEVAYSVYISISVYAASVSTGSLSWMDLAKGSFWPFQLR